MVYNHSQIKYRNSEKGKNTRKKYYQKPEVKERNRVRNRLRKDKKRLYNQRPEVKERRRIKNKEYMRKKRILNRKGVNEYQKQWRKNNRIKENEYKLKSFLIIGGSKHRYAHALRAWSKLVRVRDYDKCVLCESKIDVISHHILHKSKYPKLSLNINNGITLCKKCHKEVHIMDWFSP